MVDASSIRSLIASQSALDEIASAGALIDGTTLVLCSVANEQTAADEVFGGILKQRTPKRPCRPNFICRRVENSRAKLLNMFCHIGCFIV